MSISFNSNVHTRKHQNSFGAYGTYGTYGKNKNKGMGLGSATLLTAGGAGAGILHAKYFNRLSGSLPQFADNPDVTALKNALNVKEGEKVLKPAQKRTASTASAILKMAEEKVKDLTGESFKSAEKEAGKMTKAAKKYLSKGTKPYGKAALVGAISGFSVFLIHKIIGE